MNIARTLERSAFHHPERTALIFKDQRWTYRQLDRAASSLASGLAGLGLTPGERIGLHLPNWPEFVLTYFAASKIGLVPISLNVVYRPDELGYIINDGEAAAVVTAEPVAATADQRPVCAANHVPRPSWAAAPDDLPRGDTSTTARTGSAREPAAATMHARLSATSAPYHTPTAASDRPWPSSSRLGTYGVTAIPSATRARVRIASPVRPSASKSS